MRKPITVKLLVKYLKNELLCDEFLQKIFITGEIVDLRIHNYTYFSLREDDENILSCIYFGNDFKFSNGDKVIINGKINIYSKGSKYQLVTNTIEFVGEGDKLSKLKLLKEKLLNKGYFNDIYKKKIPKFPYKIGLITGHESAAYYDILKVINDNKYNCEIYLLSSLVQGKNAEDQISRSILYLDEMNLDLIVLTRGGGSKEDLSIFNSEIIADCIFFANTPIISAIGHEIDLSIAELVSDKYFSTPTKAGEYIVNNFNISRNNINNLNYKINILINDKLINYKNNIQINKFIIEKNNPLSKLNKMSIYINELNYKILYKYNNIIYKKSDLINKYNFIIENSHNQILKNNNIYIKNLKYEYIEIDKLKVGKEYIIYNSNNSYKIIIKEKINE